MMLWKVLHSICNMPAPGVVGNYFKFEKKKKNSVAHTKHILCQVGVGFNLGSRASDHSPRIFSIPVAEVYCLDSFPENTIILQVSMKSESCSVVSDSLQPHGL